MKEKKSKKHPLVDEVTMVKNQVHKLGKDVNVLFNKIKRKYSSLDEDTKKKIAAGIAGLGVVLAATAHYKMKKHKKSLEKE